MNNQSKTWEIDVDVTAYRNLAGGKDETIYDGFVDFNRGTYGLNECEGTVHPGFFRSLEDVAKGVREILEEITEDLKPLERDSVVIAYNSNADTDSMWGSRGYTDSSGSYSRRPLNDSEMEKLIKEVDSRVRSLFYGDKE